MTPGSGTPRKLRLSETGYHFTVELSRWADVEIESALAGLEHLVQNAHDAFMELADQQAKRNAAYTALQEALDDINTNQADDTGN